jgi:hypothetical protein
MEVGAKHPHDSVVREFGGLKESQTSKSVVVWCSIRLSGN